MNTAVLRYFKQGKSLVFLCILYRSHQRSLGQALQQERQHCGRMAGIERSGFAKRNRTIAQALRSVRITALF
jgi:hypothetical protein